MEEQEILAYLSLYDNNGKLDEKVIDNFLKDMGVQYDINNVKTMNSKQLAEYIQKQQKQIFEKEDLIKIFQFYDKSDSGSIDLSILNHILGNIGDNTCNQEQLKQIQQNENFQNSVNYSQYIDNLLKK